MLAQSLAAMLALLSRPRTASLTTAYRMGDLTPLINPRSSSSQSVLLCSSADSSRSRSAASCDAWRRMVPGIVAALMQAPMEGDVNKMTGATDNHCSYNFLASRSG